MSPLLQAIMGHYGGGPQIMSPRRPTMPNLEAMGGPGMMGGRQPQVFNQSRPGGGTTSVRSMGRPTFAPPQQPQQQNPFAAFLGAFGGGGGFGGGQQPQQMGGQSFAPQQPYQAPSRQLGGQTGMKNSFGQGGFGGMASRMRF
jgi:hypothetical protein